MPIKHSLTKRIVIVFALMIAFVAGIFAVGIVATVHVVEKRLTTIGLGGNLHRLLLIDNPNNWSHRPEKDELFFVQDGPPDLAMPHDLAALASGFQEVLHDHHAYYAMVRVINGRHYVLLRDQATFEQREHLLFIVVGVGLLASICLAVLLGWLLARRVMAPVIRLAGQVRHRDQLLEEAPPLAPDYAADEVGALAYSFDDTLGRLRGTLSREKLFTADVSHELRTPLMILASSCEVLLADPALSDRYASQVMRINRATQDMRQLVETFLQLARAEGANTHIGPRATLKEVADELQEAWDGPVQAKGLRLSYVTEGTCEGTWNRTFLVAVMGNLLRNAWHYTDAGEIRVRVGALGFVVEDTGVGIPPEQRQAMFEPFVRGDEQRGEGLGLGLSLVQRICEREGWTVQLRDRVPRGCCFEVRLLAKA